MSKTDTPIKTEIARLQAIIDVQTPAYAAAEREIVQVGEQRNGLSAARHRETRTRVRIELNPAQSAEYQRQDLEYSTKLEALELELVAANNRANAALRILNDVGPKLRYTLKLHAEIARARPVDEHRRALNDAQSVIPKVQAKIADAHQRRLAAIAEQAAVPLNDANQQLRDLPTELAFAQQAVIEAQIELHDAERCALAVDMWAADQRVEAAQEAARLAEEERVQAVNASRALYSQHRGTTERIDRLRGELELQVAALTAA